MVRKRLIKQWVTIEGTRERPLIVEKNEGLANAPDEAGDSQADPLGRIDDAPGRLVDRRDGQVRTLHLPHLNRKNYYLTKCVWRWEAPALINTSGWANYSKKLEWPMDT